MRLKMHDILHDPNSYSDLVNPIYIILMTNSPKFYIKLVHYILVIK